MNILFENGVIKDKNSIRLFLVGIFLKLMSWKAIIPQIFDENSLKKLIMKIIKKLN